MERTNLNLFYVSFVVFHLGAWFFDNLYLFFPHARRHMNNKRSTLPNVMQVVLCNQLLVLLPWMCVLDIFKWTNYQSGFDGLELLNSLFWGQLLYYSIFHSLHYMLHWPTFYRFHKLHHQSQALRAATAFYMTGFDFLLEVVIPTSAWFLYFPTERFCHACIMLSLGTLMGLYQHSGWDLCPCSFTSMLFSSEEHFRHHCPQSFKHQTKALKKSDVC